MSETTNTPNMANPSVVYLQFFVRKEKDGTWTLCLDSSDVANVPLEIGGGYQDVDAVIEAMNQSLTAPAVAENRVAILEEYIPALNQTIDAVNEMGGASEQINERLREVEKWVEAMQQGGSGFNPPTRPRIPKPGEAAGNTGINRLRRDPNPKPIYFEDPSDTIQVSNDPRPPTNRPRIGKSSLDEPRPDFNRGDFKPHVPVGRVGRGPNTVD